MRKRRTHAPCAGGNAGDTSPRPCSGSPGFSLVELLVVVALLLALTTLFWRLGGPADSARKKAGCRQNLWKIFIALQTSANDSGGKFPISPGARTSEEPLSGLVPRYAVDTSIFVCPASADRPPASAQPFRNSTISYAYYMGCRADEEQSPLASDRQIDTRPKSPGQIAFSVTGDPPGNNHRQLGGNILFCDGHVDFSPARVSVDLGLTNGVVLLNPRP